MSVNDAYQLADSLQFSVPASIVTGQPVCIGQLAGVATESYLPPSGLNPSGQVNVRLTGAFFLTVAAQSVLSPATNVAVNVGDKLYADGGTLDTATNVTYNFTLDKNAGGILYGTALDAILSGVTQIIRVRLKNSA